MLKRMNSVYSSGRVKGDWYKWKVDPFVADMVVVGAQLGHGKRANLYSITPCGTRRKRGICYRGQGIFRDYR